jgi:hypothetical protein
VTLDLARLTATLVRGANSIFVGDTLLRQRALNSSQLPLVKRAATRSAHRGEIDSPDGDVADSSPISRPYLG